LNVVYHVAMQLLGCFECFFIMLLQGVLGVIYHVAMRLLGCFKCSLSCCYCYAFVRVFWLFIMLLCGC